MTRNQKLANAFTAGYNHAKDGGLFSRRLTVKEGSLRDFWEAGYEKAEKELKAEREAYMQTPEYKEQERKDREIFTKMSNAMAYLAAGDFVKGMGDNEYAEDYYRRAHKSMNEAIGL